MNKVTGLSFVKDFILRMPEERLNKIARNWVRFTRWAIAPFCLGLLAGLLVILVQFFRELAHLIAEFPQMDRSNVILAVLKLVDLVFVANLLLMISNAGFERLVQRTPDLEHGSSDEGIVDFAVVKLRVVASISAIAAIELLETFVNIDQADKSDVLWQLAILLAFVLSGVLLAWMDRLHAVRD